MIYLNLAETGKIETDEASVWPTQRLDCTDDAGAAPEGNNSDPLRGADLEDAAHGASIGRQQHCIGRGFEPAAPQASKIGVAAAGRVA